MDDIREINRAGWNRRVAEGDMWTIPISPEEIARARQGDWSVVLTPIKPVPRDWFGDIAGKDLANPLATILSMAMMLRFTLDQPESADRVEAAVRQVLQQGLRTADIWSEGMRRVGTREMGDAVVAAITKTTTKKS